MLPTPYVRLLLIALTATTLPISQNTQAQGIRGTITDDSGNPIPGISIYIAEIQSGTITNTDGNYEYPLSKGTYNLSFQSLGYARRDFRIVVEEAWITHNIQLKPIQYSLKEVRIYSGEDPAYPIMRQAIARAPYHLRQAKNYEAEVYLKGSLNMKKIPRILQKNLEVNGEKIKPGETYTSESLNRITFSAPDSFVHKVIASRSSFPGDEESGLMGYINSSFYDASPDEMVISPLSPQAFRHYNFRYEGFFENGQVTVNKISVIPKRKSQQLVEGTLNIVEGQWNIHSVDFVHEAFWGKTRIRQMYQPVKPSIWLPISHHFDVEAAIMGIKAGFSYAGSVKYLSVNENSELKGQKPAIALNGETQPAPTVPAIPSKTQKQMDELMAKDELTNREMMKLAALIEKENEPPKEDLELEIKNTYRFDVKKDSLKRDSLFWDNIRPIPLTTNEKTGFAVRDSLKAVDAPSDSSKTKKTKSKLVKAIGKVTSGISFPGDTANVRFTYGGLIQPRHLGFNPVDGWKYAQDFGVSWKQDSVNSLKLSLMTGFAFSRQAPYGSFNVTQSYNPDKRGQISLTGSVGSEDYKTELATPGFLTMAAALLFKENYPRLFYQNQISLDNGIDLANGLRMDMGISYRNYKPQANRTNFSFFKQEEKYKPNEVIHPATTLNHFSKQEALIVKASWSYTPRYHYMMRKGKKIMTHSKYPTITLGFEQGIKAFSSNADYLLVEAGAYKKAEFSFRPVIDWQVNGGWFIRNNQMHFSNFKHFHASTIPVLFMNPAASLVLIDDYLPSTNQWFFRSNITYSSPYLLLKNLPVLSNRLWNEDLHFSYLHTPAMRHYMQAGYSISRIFMAGSVGVFAGFSEGKYQNWGVRVAFTAF